MRSAALGLFLVGAAFLSGPAAAQERDPAYDAVLAAYQAKAWAEFDRIAPAFLEENSDYVYAHSVRFMIADALRQRDRLPEAAGAFRDYLRRHPDANLADRCRGALIAILNEDQRYEEALPLAEEHLDRWPNGKAAPAVAYEYARALEELRRFDEAVAAYRTITGKYAEAAAFRRGVALFRARHFRAARESMTAFLAVYPESSQKAGAEDYLFRTDTGFERIEDGVVLDYDGKYRDDERFAAIVAETPALRRAALQALERKLGRAVPRTFLIRFADAGADRSGFLAKTRLEVVDGEPRQVVILYTEFLVTGAHEVGRTLTHELYHCLQREALGEAHFLAPKWVREGTAMYAAGQAEERSRLLAAEVGRRTDLPDPMSRLVDGLSGRHTFDDYGEDVAAFVAVERRHGADRARAFLEKLLTTPDVGAAVKEVLGEDMATFEAAAAEQARETLAPLVATGRPEILEAKKLLSGGNPAAAIDALPAEPGAYAPVAAYLRAKALLAKGNPAAALAGIRGEFLSKHRTFAPLLEDALLLELRALKALDDPGFEAAADRARKDLEPQGIYPQVLELIGK